MADPAERQEKKAYLVFGYLGMGDAPNYPENTPKILTYGFNHRLHSSVSGRCIETHVAGVIVSSDEQAVNEHEGHSYNDTPEGRKKMETDMHGELIAFGRHQDAYAELILEAVKMGAKPRLF